MGHFYGSEVHRSDLRLLIALFRAMLPLTVGGSITWLEPPPVETVTDGSRISITTKQVIQGSLNEELSCNCSLTADSSIAAVFMKFHGLPAVILLPNKSPSVEQGFAEHFDAVWVPNKLTLTFFNVTDANEGEYSCEVVTIIERSARIWIRKIQLLVLDPSQAMVSSITVPQNLIQTTVSAITASEDPRRTMASFSSSSQSPIPTTESAITASEVDVPWGIIGAAVGVADAIAIAFAITMVWFLKRRKRSQIRHVYQQRDEEVDKVQDGYALLRPLSADGLNGNHSKRDIQEKKEDPSV